MGNALPEPAAGRAQGAARGWWEAGRGGRDAHAVALPCRHPDTDLHLQIVGWGFFHAEVFY